MEKLLPIGSIVILNAGKQKLIFINGKCRTFFPDF